LIKIREEFSSNSTVDPKKSFNLKKQVTINKPKFDLKTAKSEDNDIYLYKDIIMSKMEGKNTHNISQYAEVMTSVEDYVMTNITEFIDIRIHSSKFKQVA
jgi:hypothetical protein